MEIKEPKGKVKIAFNEKPKKKKIFKKVPQETKGFDMEDLLNEIIEEEKEEQKTEIQEIKGETEIKLIADEFREFNFCPKCKGKLLKDKIRKDNFSLRQGVICKNECGFIKEIILKV